MLKAVNRWEAWNISRCSSLTPLVSITVHSENLTGRVPLILPCRHTMCEVCVRTASRQRQVTCPTCSESVPIDNKEVQLQEMFPVNFYVLGLIYYSRPTVGDNMSSFRPIGFRKQNVAQVEAVRAFEVASQGERGIFVLFLLSVSKNSNVFIFFLESCSSVECNKPAELECRECAVLYCASCCDNVHKMVRGFRKHKISPLMACNVKEISETCPVHAAAIIEYHCKDCEVDVCCHCFIQQHPGHSYYLVTELVSRK